MAHTIAVFGATGAQGSPVVEQALAQGMTVRAIGRDTTQIANTHPAAEPVSASLDDPNALAIALRGVDAAFLHFRMPTGPKDVETWIGAFTSAAHLADLPHLVYTTGGPTGDRYPSSMVIDGGTAAMKAILSSGIPSIVLQPAVYIENLLPTLFTPRLRSEGILDYPSVPTDLKVQWTSQVDQARIAVAAMTRPDLAGQQFEIGSPNALTGSELAELAAIWLHRDVKFDPVSPSEFAERVGTALGNPGISFALTDLYDALSKLSGDDMVVDTDALESLFDVRLTSIADHLASWSS